MKKTFTTIMVDTDTRDNLRKMAGDIPISTYLRKLTEEHPAGNAISMADMIAEVRSLAHDVKMSTTRLKILDLFITHAKPETLEFIKEYLTVQREAGPERWQVFKETAAKLQLILADLSPKAREYIADYIKAKDRQAETFEELIGWTMAALKEYSQSIGKPIKVE